MRNQRPPTPLERYQTWLELLKWIRTEINRNKQLDSCELTDSELEAIALKFMKSDEDELAAEKQRVNKFLKENSPEQVKTQMITISIDQKLESAKALEIQSEVIEKIQSAHYKCLTNVSHKFEYWSDEGWNPHIHIVSDKNKSDGQVAQLIRRKLKDIPEAYRIYVNTLHFEAHQAYMQGIKVDEKHEFVKKDEVFREIHKIKEIYNW